MSGPGQEDRIWCLPLSLRSAPSGPWSVPGLTQSPFRYATTIALTASLDGTTAGMQHLAPCAGREAVAPVDLVVHQCPMRIGLGLSVPFVAAAAQKCTMPVQLSCCCKGPCMARTIVVTAQALT